VRVEVDDRLFTVRIIDRPTSAGAAPALQRAPRPGRTTSANGRAAAGNDVVAPMHGVVVEIAVARGDAVSEGQVVAVIEAMKMMNEIRAHRAGTVESVLVKQGVTVEPQTPLLRLT
jgi:biotin carboxyl carrier protein